MKNLLLFMVLIVSALTACNQTSSFEPKLDLIVDNPYQLKITNFPWRYIKSEKRVIGEFESLDKKVYELLKGKEGFCEIYIQAHAQPNGFLLVGNVNLQRLSRAPSWQDWHYKNGLERWILDDIRRIEQQNSDSTKVDTVKPEKASPITPPPPQPVVHQYSSTITYEFTLDDLYPSVEKQSGFDSHQFNIVGVIGAVNYDNGVMEVITNDGEHRTVQFSPFDPSSDIISKLELALKRGNRIRATVARAGASTDDLISAKITEQQLIIRDTTRKM